MKATILKRIDSMNRLHSPSSLELSINPSNIYAQQPNKIYQVITDMFKTKLIEHNVVKVIDGKTKYESKSNKLIQSLRFVLETGTKVDLFDNQSMESYTYVRNGKTYDLLNYFFTDKEKAEKKLEEEKYRLLIKAIIAA